MRRAAAEEAGGERQRFSALQRAENSSIPPELRLCVGQNGFSALQRAENSSILLLDGERPIAACFSALQRAENSSIADCGRAPFEQSAVSVLFSEPKIPQYVQAEPYPGVHVSGFQCSSASRKFLNGASVIHFPSS